MTDTNGVTDQRNNMEYQIDPNLVIEMLAKEVTELRIQLAMANAAIATLLEEREAKDE